jgi:hypothetical protein
VRARLLLSMLLCTFPLLLKAQGEKPIYLSLSYGSDQSLEKSDRILSTAPTLLSLTLEKRLPQSEFYGIGLHTYRFISVFENYNHLSIRGYQHFGDISDAHGGNFDPYIGAFVGGDIYQASFKPAVGVFVGMRAMITQTAGLHAEFMSVSSGHNSGMILQFGLTTCFMKSEFPKLKKWGNKCPKR